MPERDGLDTAIDVFRGMGQDENEAVPVTINGRPASVIKGFSPETSHVVYHDTQSEDVMVQGRPATVVKHPNGRKELFYRDMPTTWIGPDTQERIAAIEGGDKYLGLVNDSSRRGFVEGVTEEGIAGWVPFVDTFKEAYDSSEMLAIAKSIQSGGQPTDKQLVKFNTWAAIENRRADSTFMGRFGSGLKDLTVFGGELAADALLVLSVGGAPAAGGHIGAKATGIATRKAARNYLTKLAGKAARKASVKRNINIASKIADFTVRANIRGLRADIIRAPASLTAVQNRMVDDILTGDENNLRALTLGILDTHIEHASEFSGEYIGGAVNKVLATAGKRIGGKAGVKAVEAAKTKMTQWAVGRWATRAFAPGKASQLSRGLRQIGIGGMYEEMLEERAGGFLRGLFGVTKDDDKGKILTALDAAFPIFTPEGRSQLLDEAALFAVPGAIHRASTAAVNPLLGRPMPQHIDQAIETYQNLANPVQTKVEFQRNIEAALKMLHDESHPSLSNKQSPKWMELAHKLLPAGRGTLTDMLKRRNAFNLLEVYNNAKDKAAVEIDAIKKKKHLTQADRNRIADLKQAGQTAVRDYVSKEMAPGVTLVDTEAQRDKVAEGLEEGAFVPMTSGKYHTIAATGLDFLEDADLKQVAKDIGMDVMANIDQYYEYADHDEVFDLTPEILAEKGSMRSLFGIQNAAQAATFKKQLTELAEASTTPIKMLPMSGIATGTKAEFEKFGYTPKESAKSRDGKYYMRVGAFNRDGTVYVTPTTNITDVFEDVLEAEHGKSVGKELQDEALAWHTDAVKKAKVQLKTTKSARVKREMQEFLGFSPYEAFIKGFLGSRMGIRRQGTNEVFNSLDLYGMAQEPVMDTYMRERVPDAVLDSIAGHTFETQPGPGQTTIQEAMDRQRPVAEARVAAAEASKSAELVEVLAPLNEALSANLAVNKNRQAVVAEVDNLVRNGVTFSMEESGLTEEVAELKELRQKFAETMELEDDDPQVLALADNVQRVRQAQQKIAQLGTQKPITAVIGRDTSREQAIRNRSLTGLEAEERDLSREGAAGVLRPTNIETPEFGEAVTTIGDMLSPEIFSRIPDWARESLADPVFQAGLFGTTEQRATAVEQVVEDTGMDPYDVNSTMDWMAAGAPSARVQGTTPAHLLGKTRDAVIKKIGDQSAQDLKARLWEIMLQNEAQGTLDTMEEQGEEVDIPGAQQVGAQARLDNLSIEEDEGGTWWTGEKTLPSDYAAQTEIRFKPDRPIRGPIDMRLDRIEVVGMGAMKDIGAELEEVLAVRESDAVVGLDNAFALTVEQLAQYYARYKNFGTPELWQERARVGGAMWRLVKDIKDNPSNYSAGLQKAASKYDRWESPRLGWEMQYQALHKKIMSALFDPAIDAQGAVVVMDPTLEAHLGLPMQRLIQGAVTGVYPSGRVKPVLHRQKRGFYDLAPDSQFAKLPEKADVPKTMAYTGIGSRNIPDSVAVEIEDVAAELAQKGYTVRSGGAAGADSAFEKGAMLVGVQQGEPINVWFGTGENAELSNLASRPFTYEGQDYLSVEHAYQTLKSGAFDQATYDKYTRAGVKITGKRADTRNNANVLLMENLMRESFEQNPEAQATLDATGNAPLTHTQDKGIWGKEFPRILATLRKGDAAVPDAEIYRPEDATERTIAIAREVHRYPEKLTEFTEKLMARNTNQVFGPDLETPSDFVLVWTPDKVETGTQRGDRTGGSGQAIEMASRKGIPVINMARKGWRKKLDAALAGELPFTPEVSGETAPPRMDDFVTFDTSEALDRMDVPIQKTDLIDDTGTGVASKARRAAVFPISVDRLMQKGSEQAIADEIRQWMADNGVENLIIAGLDDIVTTDDGREIMHQPEWTNRFRKIMLSVVTGTLPEQTEAQPEIAPLDERIRIAARDLQDEMSSDRRGPERRQQRRDTGFSLKETTDRLARHLATADAAPNGANDAGRIADLADLARRFVNGDLSLKDRVWNIIKRLDRFGFPGQAEQAKAAYSNAIAIANRRASGATGFSLAVADVQNRDAQFKAKGGIPVSFSLQMTDAELQERYSSDPVEVAQEQGHVFRGVRNDAQYSVDGDGSLVLPSAQNFGGRQVGVSTTPYKDVAGNYAMRTPGRPGISPEAAERGIIFQIDYDALPQDRIEAQAFDEIELSGEAAVVIPAGKWTQIPASETLEPQWRDSVDEFRVWERQKIAEFTGVDNSHLVNNTMAEMHQMEMDEFSGTDGFPMRDTPVNDMIVGKYGNPPNFAHIGTREVNRRIAEQGREAFMQTLDDSREHAVTTVYGPMTDRDMGEMIDDGAPEPEVLPATPEEFEGRVPEEIAPFEPAPEYVRDTDFNSPMGNLEIAAKRSELQDELEAMDPADHPFKDQTNDLTMSMHLLEDINNELLTQAVGGAAGLHNMMRKKFNEARARIFRDVMLADKWANSVGLGLSRKQKAERDITPEMEDAARKMMIAVKFKIDNPNETQVITGKTFIPRDERDEGDPEYRIDGPLISDIYNDWNAIKHPDMPTGEQMEATIAPVFGDRRDEFNELLDDVVEGDWIQFVENYINRTYRVAQGPQRDAQQNKMLEDTKHAKQRVFETLREAIESKGWVAAETGAHEEFTKWASNVNNAARNRLVLSTAALMQDISGAPQVIPVRTKKREPGDPAPISDLVLRETARNLANWQGKTIDEKADPMDEINRLIAEGDLREQGYRLLNSPYTTDIQHFWVRDFETGQYMRHVIDKKWDNKFTRFVESWNSRMKFAQLTLSFFHPFSLLESYASMFGVTLKNPVWKPWARFKELQELISDVNNNPEKYERYIQAGVTANFGNPDLTVGTLNEDVRKWREHWQDRIKGTDIGIFKEGAKLALAGVDTFSKLKETNDRFLWHQLQPAVKLHSAMFMEQTLSNIWGRPLTDEEMRDIGDTVNDAFGGQAWERYMYLHPKVAQILHMAMFAPDWTISAANISGITRWNPLMRAAIKPEISKIQQDWMAKQYWPAMAAIVLFGIPNVLQATFTLVARAAGEGDDDDRLFTFMNEPGKRTHVDVTPFARLMGHDDERRLYLRWGKQAYEVFEGWVTKPLRTAISKTSPLARTAMEQMFARDNIKELPFKDKGLMGIIKAEDSYLNSRLGFVAQKFVPMSILAPLQGRPSTFFAPASRGASFSSTINQLERVLEGYANPGVWRKISNNVEYVERLEMLGDDIIEGAERNGVNGIEAFNRAKAHVLGRYYREFFYELNDGRRQKKLDQLSEGIIRLHGQIDSLEKSMESKFEQYREEYREEDAALTQEALFSQGF